MNKFKLVVIVLIIIGFIGCHFVYSTVGSGNIIKEERNISSDFAKIQLSNHGILYITFGNKVELTVEGDDNIIPHMVTKVTGDTLVIRTDRKLHRGYRSRKGIKFYLTVQEGQVNYLDITSHGRVTIPKLTGKQVTIDMSSHGRVNVEKVKADHTKLFLSSHGDIKIGDLQSQSVKVRLTSHGNITIGNLNAQSINAKLTSHGKVQIKSGKVKSQGIVLTSHGDYLAEYLKSAGCEVEISSHGKVVIQVSDKLRARITSHGNLYVKGDPKIDASKKSRKRIRKIN